ncbi:MAG: thioredoxin family protein [Bacteroidales bacterium]|nr:thioredoxin family protein [Bacteroidales bacterium]
MKRILISIAVILWAVSAFPQSEDEKMPVGECTLQELQEGVFYQEFKREYADYDLNEYLVSKIDPLIQQTDIVIVLGTWCSDSKREVPRFIKILEHANYPFERLEMICVDRNKETGDISIESLNIEYVPTFILYSKGKEIGRIIESPEQSLEEDLFEHLDRID